MRSIILTAVALVVVSLGSVAVAADIEYVLTGENTKIEWTGTKPEGKHDGGFKTVTGKASLTNATGLTLNVEIDCTSLYSDDAKLTGHLKSPDFFSVKDHPKARFVSKKVTKTDKGFVVTGDLTLLGRTKEVSFPATITAGDKLTVDAEFKIDRTAFGMSYGKGKISDEVTLRVKVNAAK